MNARLCFVTAATALVAGTVLFATGCSTYQAPSTVPHVYTTSTQEYHQLAGISLEYGATSSALQEASAGALFLSQTWLEFHVDGRLVAKGPLARSLSTFLQIPPGEHELLLQYATRSAFRMGGTGAMKTRRFTFNIGPSQRAKFSTFFSNQNRFEVQFENVQSYAEIQ